jgi:3-dehydroquinate dehydratase-2
VKRVLVLNGPNLNLLGIREPSIYGHETLEEVRARVLRRAAALGLEVDFRQSNHEGELIDWINEARTTFGGILLNPAAFGHYSYAIRDAITSVDLPVIEVHISNVLAREPYRNQLVLTPVVVGMISGLGTLGYELALEAMAARLD